MATVCKLVRDGGTLVDFQGGDVGFQLVEGGWRPRVARLVDGKPTRVTEDLQAIVAGDPAAANPQDDLASYLQDLAEAQRWADAYTHDRTVEEPVWFHAKLENESGERRAFVHSIEWAQDSGYYDARATTAEMLITATVEREGVWEDVTSKDLPGKHPLALGFTSGSVEFTVGETITGNSSGDSGVVAFWFLTGGGWSTGDASGTVFLSTTNERGQSFTDGELLNGSIGGSDMATANGQASGSCVSIYDYTASDIQGDLPARIDVNAFWPTTLGRLWMGFRSDAKSPSGDAAAFVPTWEIENGTNLDGDVSNQTTTDNSASPYGGSGSDHKQLTEGTSGTDWDVESFQAICSLELDEALAKANVSSKQSLFGLMKWLLRCRVGTATTWELQLRWGYVALPDEEYIKGRVVEIDSGSWNIYPLGNQRVPLRDYRAIPFSAYGADSEDQFSVAIWGRRTSGSGDLFLDCLLTIPIDEGFLSVETSQDYSPNRLLAVGQSPKGDRSAGVYTDAELWEEFPPISSTGRFSLPPGNGRLICAQARKGSSVLGDFISIGSSLYPTVPSVGRYYERWLSLRGAE